MTPSPQRIETHAPPAPPEVEVVIEVPRGSFLKRGSSGRIDFISPLPCPYNYGAVPHAQAGAVDFNTMCEHVVAKVRNKAG